MSDRSPDFPLYGRTYEQAVQDNLDDLIEQGDTGWRGADPVEVARYLDLFRDSGVRDPVLEALWRYYEYLNREPE